MKMILLSTGFALGLGLFATAPSNAAPMPLNGLGAPSLTENVACRVVTKRVRRANGSVRVTRTRVCDRGRVFHDRRAYRPARLGVTIRVR